MKTIFSVLSIALILNSLSLKSQADNLENTLKQIKELIESKEIQGFTAGNMTFNPCKFEFDYNLENKNIVVTRVQIFKEGKSDLTMERESRSIKLSDLDKDRISFSSNSVKMLSLKIPVKKGKLVEIRTLKNGEKNSHQLQHLGIGPYKFKKHKKYLKELKKLFYQAIELAEN